MPSRIKLDIRPAALSFVGQQKFFVVAHKIENGFTFSWVKDAVRNLSYVLHAALVCDGLVCVRHPKHPPGARAVNHASDHVDCENSRASRIARTYVDEMIFMGFFEPVLSRFCRFFTPTTSLCNVGLCIAPRRMASKPQSPPLTPPCRDLYLFLVVERNPQIPGFFLSPSREIREPIQGKGAS